MTNIENLYFALGEIAYAIALADGTVQKEEKEKLHNILVKEFSKHNSNINVSEIAFQILNKDRTDTKTAYEWAINQLKLNSQYVSPELKQHFNNVILEVANAFPPVDIKEHWMALNFMKEMKTVVGDPVFCSTVK